MSLTKSRLKNYMRLEDKWDCLENILQIFVLMQKQVKKAAIAVEVLARVRYREHRMQN